MSELFGNEPFWVIALKSVLIFVFLLVYTLFNIWFERRVVAKMQHRIGPNVHGPFGLLQSLADGVKLALKEDVVVKAADKLVYVLAPILATIPAFLAWAVIPFGPEVRIPFTDTIMSAGWSLSAAWLSAATATTITPAGRATTL